MTTKRELVNESRRAAVGLLSVVAAVVALTYVLAWKPLPIAMPFFARVLLFGTPVLAVGVAWLLQLGFRNRIKTLEDFRCTLARGASIAGAAPAVFGTVPLMFFGADSSLYAWASTGAAVIHCGLRADHHRDRAKAKEASMQLRTVALAALGVTCAAIASYYVMVGLASTGIQDNDGAYYFGMARHIARTGRIDEPIVWNFLATPDQLVHSAFDYWQGLAALVLVPPMIVFGPSHRVALISTAAISALSVFLFAYVVGRAHPIRNQLLRFTLVGVFAFSESMQIYRFEPETVALAHALLLAALAAFAMGRYRTAIVVAFLLYLNRADCVLLSLVVASACFVRVMKDRKALRAVILLSAGLVGAYLARNLLAWGTLMPPGASRAPFLHSYLDLYAYGIEHPTLGSASSRIFEPKYVIDRFTVGARTLLDTALVPGRVVWYLLGVAGGLAWLRRRRSFELMVWVLAFPTVGALAWAAGTVFAPYRTLHTLLPVVVLAGGYTLDHIFSCIFAWARTAESSRWRIALALGLAFGACALLADNTRAYSARLSPRVEMEHTLAGLDELLGGAPVASTRPWFVLANTSSPVVHLPENGEAAIEAVFEKYDIQWLLVQDRYGMFRGSRKLVEELMAGQRSTIGRFRLTRAKTLPGVTVFRIGR